MPEAAQTILTRRQVFTRLSFLILPLFLFLLKFNLTSIYIISGIAAIAFIYAFAKEYAWVFLALAVPSLVFGRIIFFQVTPSWIYEMSLAEVLILSAAGVLFLDKYLNARIGEIRADFLSVLLFFYFLASALFVGNILDFRLYVFGLKVVFFSFLGYFLMINLLDEGKKIAAFLYGLAVAVFIVSLQIFMKFYDMGLSSKFFFDRSNIFIPIGPIATAAAILALLLPLLLAFYFYVPREAKTKPFILAAFILGGLALFLTLGKAAILSLLAGLLYIFVKLRSKRSIFIIAFAIFIVLSYVFFTSFFTGLFARMSQVFVDANTEFRIEEYKSGWKLIQENWLFGVGSGQQIIYHAKIFNLETGKLVNNYLLQAAIDLGVIGFLLLTSMMIAIFNKAKKILSAASGQKQLIVYGFAASLIAAFLNGLAEVTVFAIEYAIIFWAIVGAFSNLAAENFINKNSHVPHS